MALGILQERFGNTQLVKDAHFKKLMSIPVSSRELLRLRATIDEIEMHIRTLEALGEDMTHSYLIT